VLAKHGLELNLAALADEDRTLLAPGIGSVAALDKSLEQLQHWLAKRYRHGVRRSSPKE